MLKPLLLSEVASTLNGRLVSADSRFNGVSIDSRAIAQGQLFIALTGPRFDGHDYLNEVAAKGAVAALVEREVPESALPQLVVKDTREALGQLGALNRAGYNKPVATSRTRQPACRSAVSMRRSDTGWMCAAIAA